MPWPKGIPRSEETRARIRTALLERSAKRAIVTPLCACCGKPRTRRKGGGWKGAHGMCQTCANLWYEQGCPEGGPQRAGAERIRRLRETCQRQRTERVRDYAWLVSFGETREQAARRVGVSLRTARAYERDIERGEQEEYADAA
jgi:hypothetical protein